MLTIISSFWVRMLELLEDIQNRYFSRKFDSGSSSHQSQRIVANLVLIRYIIAVIAEYDTDEKKQ